MKKSPPENSTIINVCIIPPEKVGMQCVAISQALESEGTMFVLDGKTKFAHMTVYMARFTNEKIPDAVETAGQVLKGFERFACDHTGYFMTEGRYLEASYRKSPAFMALQEALIAKASPYRLNPGNPFEEAYFTPYTPEQQKNARETGYDLAGNLYRPHVTLARYKEGHVPEEFPAFPAAELSFTLAKICVYKADNNGAVYEKLKEFLI